MDEDYCVLMMFDKYTYMSKYLDRSYNNIKVSLSLTVQRKYGKISLCSEMSVNCALTCTFVLIVMM